MSALNSHRIELSGGTLREISEAAAQAFDLFFAREIDWKVVRFDSYAAIAELKDGAGQIIARREITWHATVEAEAKGIFIGVRVAEPAMWFSTP